MPRKDGQMEKKPIKKEDRGNRGQGEGGGVASGQMHLRSEIKKGHLTGFLQEVKHGGGQSEKV